jgi:histidine triad (HIT) family protein
LCIFASGGAIGDESKSVLRGSGIIIPKAHRETVFDLNPDEFLATQDLLLEVRPILDERHQPDGYTIGWNSYSASGQSVPHAHLHVLLRYGDEPLAGKGLRWLLRQPNNVRPEPTSTGSGSRVFLDEKH